MTIENKSLPFVLLIAISLAIGFGIEFSERAIFALALGRELAIDGAGVFATNALLTALPFLALSLRASQHFATWILGVFMSAAIAWWWVQKGIAYQQNPDGSGADIGGGLLMLLSPFAIAAICMWLARKLDHRRRLRA